MWPIFKMNVLKVSAFLVTMPAFMSLYWVWRGDTAYLNLVVMQSYFLFLLISSTVSLTEQYEDQNKGYKFLRMLPVTIREIVTAKFLVVLMVVVILTAYHWVFFSFFSRNADHLALSWTFTMAVAVLGLVWVGVMYVCIYRFGMSRMVKYIWFVVILYLATLVITMELLLPDMDVDLPALIALAEGPVRYLIPVAGLAAYYGLMRTAIKIKEIHEQ